ncbi:MAG: DUF2516 family protein [Marmoricola sp.]
MWVFEFEGDVILALFLLMAAMELFALVDALIRPAAAYAAAGKLSKAGWLVILVLSLLTCLAIRSPMNILGLLGAVAAGVYLADVRPALASIRRR